MKKYLALFRGINVGGNNILPMGELRSLLEEHSYKKVQTYIQSGNVVFDSEERPENVASLVLDRFGFEPRVLVMEKTEFLDSLAGNPYTATKGNQIHFYFCQDLPNANVEKLDMLKAESEHYMIKDKVLYLYAPDGIGRSKLAAGMERYLGVAATGRNLNTINKLAKMLEDG